MNFPKVKPKILQKVKISEGPFSGVAKKWLKILALALNLSTSEDMASSLEERLVLKRS